MPATVPQSDMPDFHQQRQVTDDPIVDINQAVNVTPYDSGVLDVGLFTHLHVYALASTSNSVYQLSVFLEPTSSGTTHAFTDLIYLSPLGGPYNFDYPLTTRYAQFQLTELTATGGTVRLQVSPSSGPSRTFNYFRSVALPTFQSIGAGLTVTHDPSRIARGQWRIYVASRCPVFTVQIKARDNGGADTLVFQLNNGVFPLPFDQVIRFETASLYLNFTNQWTNAVSVYLAMTLVGD